MVEATTMLASQPAVQVAVAVVFLWSLEICLSSREGQR